MKTGEASAASGCHIETIRYYEGIGLLPRPPRTAGGYRDYSPADVDQLCFITRGRELGFSLAEIKSLLRLAEDPRLHCDDVDRLARRHLGDIEERMRALRRMARELQRTITRCTGKERATCAILGALRTRMQAPGARTGMASPRRKRGKSMRKTGDAR